MISPRVASDDRLARENTEVRMFSETPMQTTQSMETPQPTVIPGVTSCRGGGGADCSGVFFPVARWDTE